METSIAATPERPEKLLNFSGSHRMPVILQTEVAECGLACLAMIAGYNGFTTDLTHLRQKFPISSRGTNLKQVMDIAARVNLSPRALRLSIPSLNKLQLPCILHWDLNHFVVLKAIKRRQVVILDPAVGERAIELEELGRHFSGVALELTPTPNFERKDEVKTLRLSHFWNRVTGLKRNLLQVLALSLLLQVFAVVSPFYMQVVVDDVLLRNDSNLLIVLALGFGLLTLIQIGTSTLRELVIVHLSNSLAIQMSANLFRHLIRLPMDYFTKRHMGDIVSRFGSLKNIRELLTTGLITAVIDGMMALITLAAMLFYSANLTLLVLTIVVLYGLLRWAFYRPFRLLSEEGIIASAKENSHFMESIRAIQTIKLFQKENDRQSHWQNRLADAVNKNIRLANWQVFYNVLNGLLFGVENVLVIYLAADAVMDNLISIGMLYAFMSYKGRFIGAMDGLITQWIDYKMLGLHLNRLADIAHTPKEDVDDYQGLWSEQRTDYGDIQIDIPTAATLHEMAKDIAGKIEARNLAYRYSDMDPPVFTSLNFSIQPGETVAFIGPSGCGKTTLLKCLMGLMKPTEGDILVDGQPLKHLTHYRSRIAGVMQEDALLSGSITENIACLDPKIDMNKVVACAQLACFHHEILQMPMQYNTLVGDMGASLSGGQKQRLILARALYREPAILFMDEATSHLDTNNEQLINQHIKQLGMTRVLVAHRQETIQTADRVIDLRLGQMITPGNGNG